MGSISHTIGKVWDITANTQQILHGFMPSKREVFGKVVMVKAKPARTVVKAFPVSALKKAF